MMRKLFGLGLVVVLFGGAAWAIVSVQGLIHSTQHTLSQTTQAIQHNQQALEDLGTQQDRLATGYRAIAEQVGTVTQTATQLGTKQQQHAQTVDVLTTRGQAVQDALHTANQQLDALRQDVQTLVTQNQALQGETERLKHELEELTAAPQVSPEELEQLTARVTDSESKQETTHQTLEAKVLELSRAYDQLLAERTSTIESAQPQIQALAREQEVPEGFSPFLAQAIPTVVKQAEPTARAQNPKQLAIIHRELGEAYFALHNYPKAAEELEQSLTFQDDQQIHAQLALLYGRFVHNQKLASLHASKSSSEALMTATSPTARASGLPRKSKSLVWEWFGR